MDDRTGAMGRERVRLDTPAGRASVVDTPRNPRVRDGRLGACVDRFAFLAGALLVGVLSPRPPPPPTGTKEGFTIKDPRITESSGLAASRQHPGVYWTHNDSDDGRLPVRRRQQDRRDRRHDHHDRRRHPAGRRGDLHRARQPALRRRHRRQPRRHLALRVDLPAARAEGAQGPDDPRHAVRGEVRGRRPRRRGDDGAPEDRAGLHRRQERGRRAPVRGARRSSPPPARTSSGPRARVDLWATDGAFSPTASSSPYAGTSAGSRTTGTAGRSSGRGG